MFATSISRTRQSLGRILLSATQRLDVPLVVETVKQGADVNHRGIYGDTALQQLLAMIRSLKTEIDAERWSGDLDNANSIVEFLLENGAKS